ncbi:hypothetical protein Cgig2_020209 [Carnegiea gigantea]|uniref:Uncharacterized protein n=1 Tax=Carnegiea gigantea TaxID=171969 RepID=A0A9Q1KXW1_9CARY|nr:hypothetical protein Cgig2_020209 [Carnegiea gigantea]
MDEYWPKTVYLEAEEVVDTVLHSVLAKTRQAEFQRRWESATIFSLAFGGLCYFGSQRLIGAVNGVLVIGIIASFTALVGCEIGVNPVSSGNGRDNGDNTLHSRMTRFTLQENTSSTVSDAWRWADGHGGSWGRELQRMGEEWMKMRQRRVVNSWEAKEKPRRQAKERRSRSEGVWEAKEKAMD